MTRIMEIVGRIESNEYSPKIISHDNPTVSINKVESSRNITSNDKKTNAKFPPNRLVTFPNTSPSLLDTNNCDAHEKYVP
mmetsp:Transcript_25160/g.45543  ORF Transcript_25160/g.45543 Transcript_25160/m.45543 type:complete len:80 (-) Transcript_25160:519-758(-)